VLPVAQVNAATAAAAAALAVQLRACKRPELVARCKAAGLPSSGTKDVLTARLLSSKGFTVDTLAAAAVVAPPPAKKAKTVPVQVSYC
jgi:hypothetical protein